MQYIILHGNVWLALEIQQPLVLEILTVESAGPHIHSEDVRNKQWYQISGIHDTCTLH